jgi:HK97 gp10 family phage protein
MPAARVRVLFDRLPAIVGRQLAAVAGAVDETLTAIEQDVKGGGPHAAPYRTGNLRRSYHKTLTGPAQGEVGNDPQVAHYAIYVELGTRRMAPRPHLVPAAEAQRAPFAERVRRALRA